MTGRVNRGGGGPRHPLASAGLTLAALALTAAPQGCTGELDYQPEEYSSGVMTPGPAVIVPPSPPPAAMGTPAGPSPSPGAAPAAAPAGGQAPPASAAADPCAGLDALAILGQRCGTCHGERSPTKGLDLVSAGVGKRLVDVRSGCMGRPYLAGSEKAEQSLFVAKMDGAVTGCGGQMPFGATPLSPAERACLVDWSEKAIARETGR